MCIIPQKLWKRLSLNPMIRYLLNRVDKWCAVTATIANSRSRALAERFLTNVYLAGLTFDSAQAVIAAALGVPPSSSIRETASSSSCR